MPLTVLFAPFPADFVSKSYVTYPLWLEENHSLVFEPNWALELLAQLIRHRHLFPSFLAIYPPSFTHWLPVLQKFETVKPDVLQALIDIFCLPNLPFCFPENYAKILRPHQRKPTNFPKDTKSLWYLTSNLFWMISSKQILKNFLSVLISLRKTWNATMKREAVYPIWCRLIEECPKTDLHITRHDLWCFMNFLKYPWGPGHRKVFFCL